MIELRKKAGEYKVSMADADFFALFMRREIFWKIFGYFSIVAGELNWFLNISPMCTLNKSLYGSTYLVVVLCPR